MDKAKLTSDQAKSLRELTNNPGWSMADIVKQHAEDSSGWANDCQGLNGMDLDVLIRAIYIGYEELTVEEQLHNAYIKPDDEDTKDDIFYNEAFNDGFRAVLNIIGMKIKGINE